MRVAEGELAAWNAAPRGIAADEADTSLIRTAATALSGVLAAQSHRAGGVAYICSGVNCLPPIVDPAELGATVRAQQSRTASDYSL